LYFKLPIKPECDNAMNCFVTEQDNAGLQKTGREDEQGGGQEKRE